MTKPPRLAAALVPFRLVAGGSPEIYWVRRGDTVPFMAGFHSFPGGAVDKDDAGLLPDDPARAAAIRETFEETGVLFAAGAAKLDAGARFGWRTRILAKAGAERVSGPDPDRALRAGRGSAPDPDRATFARLVRDAGLVLSPEALHDGGRWITPPFAPLRFDTRFFFAEVPAGETPTIWTGELAEGSWIRPAEALARWEKSKALLAPPTLHILRVAASTDDVDAWPRLAAEIPEARGETVRRIEIRPGILLVPLLAPTLPPATHTNCYIAGGNRPVVIDPGAPDPADAKGLDDLLGEMMREGRRPSRIVITHWHVDHVAGVEALRAWLRVPVAAHADTRELLAGSVKVDELLGDGDLLDTGDGGAVLRTLHTPGHAKGHLAFVDSGTHSLFSGDLILGMGTTVIDPPDGDMEQYMKSLERLAGMELAALFPGHGPVLASTLAKIDEYRRHREAREGQVLRALKDRARTPEEIVAAAYTDVPVMLHAFAARSVIAHLEWLEKRGMARRVASGRWERAPS